MAKKYTTRDARIRELLFRDKMTNAQAALAAGVTVGTIAGVRDRTPTRIRATLTATS